MELVVCLREGEGVPGFFFADGEGGRPGRRTGGV